VGLPDQTQESCLLDTGSNNSTLNEQLFDKFLKQGAILGTKTHGGFAAGGSFSNRTGYLSELTVLSFVHRTLRVDRDPTSAIGLRYLSRYKVRFDFPRSRVFFEPQARYSIPDPIATSGLSIVQNNGQK